MRSILSLLPALCLLSGIAAPPATAAGNQSFCPHLEVQAMAHGVPAPFFVRLIWQESRFNPAAVSPKGAQGIAQFMPATAAERGLEDPFEPAAAIAESAMYLRDLMDEFGNPGLAAAAYNAGPQRVRDWLTGRGGLPRETRGFVRSITGRPAEDWRAPGAALPEALQQTEGLRESCVQLAVRALPETPRLPVDGETAPRHPWGVQLAADFARSRALARFDRIRKRHAGILAGHDPMIVRERNLSIARQVRYAAMIGTESREEANVLCSRLRKAGGACMVTRTGTE